MSVSVDTNILRNPPLAICENVIFIFFKIWELPQNIFGLIPLIRLSLFKDIENISFVLDFSVNMKEIEIIKSARDSFDKQLHTNEYKKIHSDKEHLEKLVGLLNIKNNKYYLDLGTGDGYVAFELARRFKNIIVYGLDIAAQSIKVNNNIKKRDKINNIDFFSYNGSEIPFEDNYFYGIISRYAFHHFPNPDKLLQELKRIIEPRGFFILSDPTPYEDDKNYFIDKFQSLLPDGHVHFYTRKEIEKYFKKYNFTLEKEFYSLIRYPRQMNAKYRFLFNNTEKKLLEKYKVTIENDKVFIKVQVMNIRFRYMGNSI